MNGNWKLCCSALAALLAGPALADDLRGSDRFLCTAVQATVCVMGGDCEVGSPWDYNIPQFIEVDLEAKKLSTTKSSGEGRSTPIRSIEREGGTIFLQGMEGGRAFSFVIAEETGMVSVGVARDGVTVGVFGACTPLAR
jgi:hypothetical protein